MSVIEEGLAWDEYEQFQRANRKLNTFISHLGNSIWYNLIIMYIQGSYIIGSLSNDFWQIFLEKFVFFSKQTIFSKKNAHLKNPMRFSLLIGALLLGLLYLFHKYLYYERCSSDLFFFKFSVWLFFGHHSIK